jgi:hypothetical protein
MSTVRSLVRRITLAVLLPSFAPAAMPAQSLSYVGGLQYATGDFIFTQRTWSAYLSNGLSWSDGRLRASVNVPLVMQPSGWVQYSGAGMMVPSGGMSSSGPSGSSGVGGMGSGMHGGTMTPSSDMPFSRVGIGDPIGRVDVALSRADADHPSLSLVGAAKAPFTDVGHGYGTGEWDVGAGLSGAVSVGGTSILADAVYWKLGNPAGASLRNAVAYALSIGRPLPSSHWSVLGTVFGASSLWAGLEAPVQAGIGAGYLLESGSSVFAMAAVGLTRTAPAISTGLGWRVPLGKAR